MMFIIVALGILIAAEVGDKQILFRSKHFEDKDIPFLRLTKLFIRIRECQILSIRSQRSSFIGGALEFIDAHLIMERVIAEDPVEKQQTLLRELREISWDYDDDLLKRCRDYADRITNWNHILILDSTGYLKVPD